MADATIEPDLSKFIQAYLPSVEHLEILLLVNSSAEHCWTVRAINDLLRSNEDSVRARLNELTRKGLLQRSAGEESFQAHENPALEELITRLRLAYKERRVRVIETIYAPRTETINEFSQAFKFWGGK